MTKGSYFLIDYYLTKRSEEENRDEYDIIDKIKIKGYSSDGENLGDNIDVFIPKKEFPKGKTPQKHDLVFFTSQKRFYEALGYEDAGEFFIINVNPCKCKEK
jgi:hypothetical protein